VYVEGTLVFDGRSYGPVGVRLKGVQSFETIDKKPSLRINVNKYAPDAEFFGLSDMTWNNMHSDYSMMHERMAYWVARRSGIPASRCNHALITVNGEFFGLYANVETIKKKMIGRWFSDNTGPLFEATDVELLAKDVPKFELVTGPDDRSLLQGAAEALGKPSADEAITAVSAFVNMEEFLQFWAVEAMVAQFDAMPYSDPGDDYYAYADPTSGRLSFIPSGIDEAFYSGQLDITAVKGLLARRCKESAPCFQKFVDRVWKILADLEAFDWKAERTRIIAQIAPHVERDTRKWYTAKDVADYQMAMWWFINDRRLELGKMIPPPSKP
jgi:spore coat protein CotH